jgi:hypothetical protein
VLVDPWHTLCLFIVFVVPLSYTFTRKGSYAHKVLKPLPCGPMTRVSVQKMFVNPMKRVLQKLCGHIPLSWDRMTRSLQTLSGQRLLSWDRMARV